MAKDGGPAYPTKNVKENIRGEKRIEHYSGMSLRDWFAGQALVGLLASGELRQWDRGPATAYTIADAMLTERDKQ